MSAVSPAISADPRASGAMRRSRRPITASLVFSGPVIALLAWGAYRYREDLARSWRELLFWAAAIAFLNLLDIPAWNGRHLSPALPLSIALSLLASPTTSGLVLLIATFDRREFRRSIPWGQALFNRCQHALAATTASFVVAGLDYAESFDSLLLPAFLSLAAQTIVNYLAVGLVTALAEGQTLRASLSRLVIGSRADFVFTWLAWGVTGYLLLVARGAMGPWSLITFAGLALVGRQVLVRSEGGRLSRQQLLEREQQLTFLESRISKEREDERRAVAAHLHDELLPPLYQASLLSHVVRQDLATGRLLELEDDLPPLTEACDSASERIRDVIRDLRRPSSEAVVPATLDRLAREVERRWDMPVAMEIQPLGHIRQEIEIVLYQVCKEALLNAATHAGPCSATVRIMRDAEYLRFSIEDNGVGFDTSAVDGTHFGLTIMKERVESLGGLLHIDSRLTEGTIVAARLPL